MQVGDVVIVVAAPASNYHVINGEPVTIINMFMYKNKAVFTFIHKDIGYGSMEAHGFKPR